MTLAGLNLSPWLYAKVDLHAVVKGTSKSEIIRRALEEYIEKHKEEVSESTIAETNRWVSRCEKGKTVQERKASSTT